ncbi:hopanoid-associated sugar epimerase [Thermodesulforhabdus norvegica]|uniref:Dihydroflavonol-4-reductase n=1 Tax=Thermodesulforhabdus norvegica TaxID=39841 RepID=A0A1I4R9M9_9BACT|nr:hopanoid-associated sugar epimerase [Thermodesulforhabdus norvegica]SFM48919.1 dihydroflavonol-4-reductase [Thermodesulforhabdus norvegica]
MPRAFVTGGTGFVGSHVIECLVSKGWHVVALARSVRLPSFINFPGVNWVPGDILASDVLKKAMTGCDALFHVAADYRLWARNALEIYRNNVMGTRRVLSVARELRIPRVVYTSSVGALGLRRDGRPADETTPVSYSDMIGHYKRSKFLAERIAEEYARSGLDLVIVNPSTPVGPRDHKPTPTGRVIVDFLNRRMPAYVNTGLNFVHVRDVALGHLLAWEKGISGRKYILGNENLSFRDFLRILSEITGLPAPKIRIPYLVALTAGVACEIFSRLTGRPPSVPLEGVRMSRYLMFFSPERAVKELGLPLTPVRQAVKEAVWWYVKNGYCKTRLPISPGELLT